MKALPVALGMTLLVAALGAGRAAAQDDSGVSIDPTPTESSDGTLVVESRSTAKTEGAKRHNTHADAASKRESKTHGRATRRRRSARAATEPVSDDDSASATTPPGSKVANTTPPNTAVIPPAANRHEPQFEVEPDPAVDKEIAAYQQAQNPQPYEMPLPPVHSLHEFLSQTNDLSPLGVELREDIGRLASGQRVSGLAVISVKAESPAALAGIRGYNGAAHNLIEGASVAAALFFPPAILVLTLVDQTRVGESYDLIIGVDGLRVTNLVDFEDRMRVIKPGEKVYLSVVRDGARVQIPVEVPRTD